MVGGWEQIRGKEGAGVVVGRFKSAGWGPCQVYTLVWWSVSAAWFQTIQDLSPTESLLTPTPPNTTTLLTTLSCPEFVNSRKYLAAFVQWTLRRVAILYRVLQTYVRISLRYRLLSGGGCCTRLDGELRIGGYSERWVCVHVCVQMYVRADIWSLKIIISVTCSCTQTWRKLASWQVTRFHKLSSSITL